MSNEIQPTDPPHKHTDLVEFVKTLEEDALPMVTGCKLCASAHRKEAEDQFERNGNVSMVTRWLKDKGEEISNTAVNNHLNNHYKRIQRNSDLREYAFELARWSQLSKSDETMYSRYIDSLDREHNILMAENPRLDAAEKRKNIELCLKIGQMITIYKEQLRKLELEKRPVEIFVDTINRIIKVKLQDTKSPEVRRALEDVVTQLSKEVEQVPDHE